MENTKKDDALFCLDFHTSDITRDPITVWVWPPHKEKETQAWMVSSYVEGIEDKPSQTRGADPFQAFTLTMQRIRSVFEAQSYEYLHEDAAMRSIFPIHAPNHVYGIEFQDEIEAMIQKRVDEEEQRLTDKFSKIYPEHYKNVLDKNDEDKEGGS